MLCKQGGGPAISMLRYTLGPVKSEIGPDIIEGLDQDISMFGFAH
jgi:hypothetical protein